jgi:SNF2 family DNA or RNA helicase
MSTEQMMLYTKYLEHGKLDHKKYQFEGVQWCVDNETRSDPQCGVRGGFIADEMGLGKTIMVIGTIVANFMPMTLIVVPPILLNQWYLQIYKTTGHKAIIYHGANKKKITLQQLESSIIVLTTYSSTLSTFGKSGAKEKDTKRSIDTKECNDLAFASLLGKVEWNRVVFDEAHHLRNKNSHHHWAKQLKTKIRWLVSGTPVQNKRRDFYNLCSVIGLPASFYMDPVNIPVIARSFILKRTKQQVGIQLPGVALIKNVIPWKNKNELELSEEIHSNFEFAKVGTPMRRRLEGGQSKLSLLLKARQMCILPSLLKKSMRTSDDVNYYSEALGQTSKIDEVVDAILKRKDNGCGKLIFCHFRGEIDLIFDRLVAGGMTNVSKIDGRYSGKQRSLILEEKKNAIILQIQTGCEGLNLQKYNEVYFVSPHWNPAVEDQAIARCHRIGQTKQVLVERFVMGAFTLQDKKCSKAGGGDEDAAVSSTIDDYVTSVQDNKRLIAEEMFSQ